MNNNNLQDEFTAHLLNLVEDYAQMIVAQEQYKDLPYEKASRISRTKALGLLQVAAQQLFVKHYLKL